MSSSEMRQKTAEIRFRVSPDDLALLRQKAADAGQQIPAYLLACSLSRKTRTAMQDHIINELRVLGEQQRCLHRASDGQNAIEYRAVLVELIAAIRRIGA